MRCFICIQLPPEIKQYLGQIMVQLEKQNQGARIKWVEAENLHLTLAFLGEISAPTAQSLLRQLQTVRFAPFNVTLDKLSAFPNLNAPRVIKIELLDQDRHWQKIIATIQKILRELQMDLDQKPFSAHLTLGRIKDGGVIKINLQYDVSPLTFTVSNINLMQSALTSSGPIYTKLYASTAGI